MSEATQGTSQQRKFVESKGELFENSAKDRVMIPDPVTKKMIGIPVVVTRVSRLLVDRIWYGTAEGTGDPYIALGGRLRNARTCRVTVFGENIEPVKKMLAEYGQPKEVGPTASVLETPIVIDAYVQPMKQLSRGYTAQKLWLWKDENTTEQIIGASPEAEVAEPGEDDMFADLRGK